MSEQGPEKEEAVTAVKHMQEVELPEAEVDETISQSEEQEANIPEQLTQMTEEERQLQKWKENGHGEYVELNEEEELFTVFEKSPNVVVHFYKKNAPRCEIMDHHLTILAKQHMETKFCKILVDITDFCVEVLNIRIIPTLMLITDGEVVDYIVGFTDLGNRDDFKTEVLEWRLAVSKMINYSGDLSYPPTDEYLHSLKNFYK